MNKRPKYIYMCVCVCACVSTHLWRASNAGINTWRKSKCKKIASNFFDKKYTLRSVQDKKGHERGNFLKTGRGHLILCLAGIGVICFPNFLWELSRVGFLNAAHLAFSVFRVLWQKNESWEDSLAKNDWVKLLPMGRKKMLLHDDQRKKTLLFRNNYLLHCPSS